MPNILSSLRIVGAVALLLCDILILDGSHAIIAVFTTNSSSEAVIATSAACSLWMRHSKPMASGKSCIRWYQDMFGCCMP